MLTTQIVLHRSDPKDSKFADIIDRSLVEAWIHDFITSLPNPLRRRLYHD